MFDDTFSHFDTNHVALHLVRRAVKIIM